MPEQVSLSSFRDTRTLDEKLTSQRENWMPHSNHDQPRSVSGLVIDQSERELGFGATGNAPFFRVLSDDGLEWSIAGYHAVLRMELQRVGPNIGDRIGVLYEGEGKAKENQSAPHMYRVVVERNPDGPQRADPELAPAPDFGDPDADIPF